MTCVQDFVEIIKLITQESNCEFNLNFSLFELLSFSPLFRGVSEETENPLFGTCFLKRKTKQITKTKEFSIVSMINRGICYAYDSTTRTGNVFNIYALPKEDEQILLQEYKEALKSCDAMLLLFFYACSIKNNSKEEFDELIKPFLIDNRKVRIEVLLNNIPMKVDKNTYDERLHAISREINLSWTGLSYSKPLLLYPIDCSPLDTLTSSFTILEKGSREAKLIINVASKNVSLIIHLYKVGRIVMNENITKGIIEAILMGNLKGVNNYDLLMMGGVWKSRNEEAKKLIKESKSPLLSCYLSSLSSQIHTPLNIFERPSVINVIDIIIQLIGEDKEGKEQYFLIIDKIISTLYLRVHPQAGRAMERFKSYLRYPETGDFYDEITTRIYLRRNLLSKRIDVKNTVGEIMELTPSLENLPESLVFTKWNPNDLIEKKQGSRYIFFHNGCVYQRPLFLNNILYRYNSSNIPDYHNLFKNYTIQQFLDMHNPEVKVNKEIIDCFAKIGITTKKTDILKFYINHPSRQFIGLSLDDKYVNDYVEKLRLEGKVKVIKGKKGVEKEEKRKIVDNIVNEFRALVQKDIDNPRKLLETVDIFYDVFGEKSSVQSPDIKDCSFQDIFGIFFSDEYLSMAEISTIAKIYKEHYDNPLRVLIGKTYMDDEVQEYLAKYHPAIHEDLGTYKEEERIIREAGIQRKRRLNKQDEFFENLMKGYKGSLFRIITIFKSSEKITEHQRNLEKEVQIAKQKVLSSENEEAKRKLKDEKKSRKSPKTPINRLSAEEKRAKKLQKKNQECSTDEELESNISPNSRNSPSDRFPQQRLSEEQRFLKEAEKELEDFTNTLEKVISDLKEYLYEMERESEEETFLKIESKYEIICNKYDVDPNIAIQSIQNLFSINEEYRHVPSYQIIRDNGGDEYFTHLPETETQGKITLSRYSKNVSLLRKDGSPRFIELRLNGLLSDNDIRFLAQLEADDKPPEEERTLTPEEQAKLNLRLIDGRREETLSPFSLNTPPEDKEERPFFICYALLHHMTRKKLKFNTEEFNTRDFLAKDEEEEEEYNEEAEEKIALVNYTIYSIYASEYVKRYIVR